MRISVRALEPCYNCNRGEVFGLTVEEYEIEMQRARPRVEPALPSSTEKPDKAEKDNESESGELSELNADDDSRGAEPEKNREGKASRKRS